MVSLPHLPLGLALGLALASTGLAQPAAPPLKLTLQQASTAPGSTARPS